MHGVFWELCLVEDSIYYLKSYNAFWKLTLWQVITTELANQIVPSFQKYYVPKYWKYSIHGDRFSNISVSMYYIIIYFVNHFCQCYQLPWYTLYPLSTHTTLYCMHYIQFVTIIYKTTLLALVFNRQEDIVLISATCNFVTKTLLKALNCSMY